MTTLRDVSTAELLAEVQQRWESTPELEDLLPPLRLLRRHHLELEPRPLDGVRQVVRDGIRLDGPRVLTAADIRAVVDDVHPRTTPTGSVNAQHVAMEQTLRDRYGVPRWVASLDGPGRFLPDAGPLETSTSWGDPR